MSDSSADRPRGPFSWLRDLFKLKKPRPPITRPDRDLERETLEVQLDIIRRAFDGEMAVASSADGEFDFCYHPAHALVRREDVAAVATYFRESDDYDGEGSSDEVIDGLAIYHVPRRRDDGDVLVTLGELEREVRRGIATPDHILYVVSYPGKPCPATEPLLPMSSTPVPPVNTKANAGRGVRVSVVDTGWYAPAAQDSDTPWVHSGIEGDQEQPLNGVIHEYGGHGTFVAGVIKCMAPATDIEVEGFLTKGGAIYESEISKQLVEAMTDFEDNPRTARVDPRLPDLISISAGTHTWHDLGLISFEVLAALYKWAEDGGPLVVAAAGNEGKDKRFYPAAFDWVLSVGSLDRDGGRSDFSNFGKWVDVYAHGRDLVNAFMTGTYKYVEPASGALFGKKRNFTGVCQWSGTSFATPIVTGAIAAYMTEHKVTARQARDALIQAAPTSTDQKAGTMKQLGPPFM